MYLIQSTIKINNNTNVYTINYNVNNILLNVLYKKKKEYNYNT